MTEREWTPGPWVRDCWDILGRTLRNGGGTGHVCEVSTANGVDDKYWHEGESDANAHLIAAAPELYEALVKAADALGEAGARIPSDVTFALAKARGEQ